MMVRYLARDESTRAVSQPPQLLKERATPSRPKALLDEGIVANDQLLARLDDTLSRTQAFRDERAAAAVRLRERRSQLDEDTGASTGSRGGAGRR